MSGLIFKNKVRKIEYGDGKTKMKKVLCAIEKKLIKGQSFWICMKTIIRSSLVTEGESGEYKRIDLITLSGSAMWRSLVSVG